MKKQIRICRICKLDKNINLFRKTVLSRYTMTCSKCLTKKSSNEYKTQKGLRGKASIDYINCVRRDQTHEDQWMELDNGI